MNNSENGSDQLTLFAAVSHASHLAMQGNEKAETTNAISGRRCFALYGRLSPLSSLVKTLLDSSVWTAGIYSKKYSLIWKVKGTKFNRLLFQLYPSERHTDGTEFGLLHEILGTPRASERKRSKEFAQGRKPTPIEVMSLILPTPAANKTTEQFTNKEEMRNADGTPWTMGKKPHNKAGQPKQTTLADYVAFFSLLPTPNAADNRDRGGMDTPATLRRVEKGKQIGLYATITSREGGMKLQPAFVEWMMGYPEGWTSLEQQTTEPKD